MIITVSGLTGSGKDTLGKELAKQLSIRHVCPTFKDLAARAGVSLMEFQERAAKNPEIDREFDALLKEEASKGSCVATSWLSPWMLKSDLRIYLFAPLKVRASRIAKRDGMPAAKATEHVKMRDSQNKERYMKLYGIDIMQLDEFDLCFNSSKFSPSEMIKIIADIIKQSKK